MRVRAAVLDSRERGGLRACIYTERPIQTFVLYEPKPCGLESVNAQDRGYPEVLEAFLLLDAPKQG